MDELISKKTVLDAIDEISREVDDGDGFNYAKWREYFCELPSVLGTNLAEVGTDCISRQAAIDICANTIDLWRGQLGEGALIAVRDKIKELPSAQPEIVRCKDCKYGEQDEVGRWFCISLGCQIGNEDGSGYCADAERRTDE